MHELPQKHFGRVSRLFDTKQPLTTFIFSALEGRTPGRVFVDDLGSPQNCLLVSPFIDSSFTHATVDQSWLNDTLAAARRESAVLLNWPSTFSPRLQEPPGIDDSNSGHEFTEYHPQGNFQLPANRQLRFIDAALLTRCVWGELMVMAFGTIDNYLTNGAGICVMDGEEICSEAYAVYFGAGKFEIGIVTQEKYRMKGNGSLACKALIQLMEERGYPPNWSYFGGNDGSPALARSLGFGAQRDYMWLHYPQIS